jgi:hypothetical protein
VIKFHAQFFTFELTPAGRDVAAGAPLEGSGYRSRGYREKSRAPEGPALTELRRALHAADLDGLEQATRSRDLGPKGVEQYLLDGASIETCDVVEWVYDSTVLAKATRLPWQGEPEPVAKLLGDLAFEAYEHGQAAGTAADFADRDPAHRSEHLGIACNEAALAKGAAAKADALLARARDKAHGARAAARKAGTLSAEHETAIAYVERNLRSVVDLAHAFARVARSFAREGMGAHDREVTRETIRRLCEQASVAKSADERADLLHDAEELRRDL